MKNQTEVEIAAKKRHNQKVALGFIIFAAIVAAIVLMSGSEEKKVAVPTDTAPVVPREVTDEQGLTEAQRMEIFKVIVAAEAMARNEADEQYSTDIKNPDYERNIPLNIEVYQELTAKYHDEVQEQHDITEDQLFDIGSEGNKNLWPRE